ncbi:CpsB/CapC family capsule biosynthesis tyrosine phosphatase [Exiguobacterium sp.]|uniref:tyrosine-protein phosphatase n=1 Tax=Exiguobacterium sp. TaxID=44751 RepID=UPI00263B95A5|nr:CpsB/CapC family capsule biosynthesis tyrosine phosphatase [Exiguobacterium sp.]MCC5893800.1 protein tyrosine phosphatase [Exiguobacterium sp.]
MIDIHCHLLPAVDDGAQNVEVSIAMAKRAVESGVSDIIVTPHAFHRQFDTSKLNVHQAVDQLQRVLTLEGIALNVHAGQEIRIFGDLLKALEKGEALTLAGSRYVLIEFPSDSVPAYAEQLFFNLQAGGYTPIIAHPERNKELAQNPGRLLDFVASGALSQVTTGSLVGQFGKTVQQLAHVFLRNGLSQLVASDAHDVTSRSFYWDETLKALENLDDEELVDNLLQNGKSVLEDQFVYVDPPILPTKNWRGKWK